MTLMTLFWQKEYSILIKKPFNHSIYSIFINHNIKILIFVSCSMVKNLLLKSEESAVDSCTAGACATGTGAGADASWTNALVACTLVAEAS